MTGATLTKWGNGQGIRIPKLYTDDIGVSIGDSLELTVLDAGLLISKKQTPSLSLEDLFADYSGSYKPGEWDIGEPSGREI